MHEAQVWASTIEKLLEESRAERAEHRAERAETRSERAREMAALAAERQAERELWFARSPTRAASDVEHSPVRDRLPTQNARAGNVTAGLRKPRLLRGPAGVKELAVWQESWNRWSKSLNPFCGESMSEHVWNFAKGAHDDYLDAYDAHEQAKIHVDEEDFRNSLDDESLALHDLVAQPVWSLFPEDIATAAGKSTCIATLLFEYMKETQPAGESGRIEVLADIETPKPRAGRELVDALFRWRVTFKRLDESGQITDYARAREGLEKLIANAGQVFSAAVAVEKRIDPGHCSKKRHPQPGEIEEYSQFLLALARTTFPIRSGTARVAITEAEVNATATDAKRKEACRNFAAGRCTRGDECRYLHDANAAPKVEPPAAASAKKRLCHFFARGACTRGESCAFLHEGNANTPAEPKAKAKAKAKAKTKAKRNATTLVTDAFKSALTDAITERLNQGEGTEDKSASASAGVKDAGKAEVLNTHTADAMLTSTLDARFRIDTASTEDAVGNLEDLGEYQVLGEKCTVRGSTGVEERDQIQSNEIPYSKDGVALHLPGVPNLKSCYKLVDAGIGFSWMPKDWALHGARVYERESDIAHGGKECEIVGRSPILPDCELDAPRAASSEEVRPGTIDDESSDDDAKCWYTDNGCFRCGSKDHWVRNCPFENHENFEITEGTGLMRWEDTAWRTRRMIQKTLRRTGDMNDEQPPMVWTSCAGCEKPLPISAARIFDVLVDRDLNAQLVRAVDPMNQSAFPTSRFLRVYFGYDEPRDESREEWQPSGWQEECKSRANATRQRCVGFDSVVRTYQDTQEATPVPLKSSMVTEVQCLADVLLVVDEEMKKLSRMHKKAIVKARIEAWNAVEASVKSRNPTWTPGMIRFETHRALNHTPMIPDCIECAEAKQRREAHRHQGITDGKHDRWVLDIAGAIRPRGIEGSRYFVAGVDESSGNDIAEPLCSKHSAVTKLALEKVMRERGSAPHSLGALRTDGAGSFRGEVSKWVDELCSGVSRTNHEVMPRYSPWCLGKAEGKVGQRKDDIRVALLERNAPGDWWPYALRWARDTHNIATGTYASIYGQEALEKVRKKLVPFATLATVVREESDRDAQEDTHAPRARQGLVIGYSGSNYVIAFPKGDQTPPHVIVSQNVKTFLNRRINFAARTQDGERVELHDDEPDAMRNDPVRFGESEPAPAREAEPGASPEDERGHWVGCDQCGKWREFRACDREAIAELDEVECADVGYKCEDPQDPNAFRDVVAHITDAHGPASAAVLFNRNQAKFEHHVFVTESVTRSRALSNEPWVGGPDPDGKVPTFREKFLSAAQKELGTLKEYQTFGHREERDRLAMEKAQAHREFPDALFSRADMIYAIKFIELRLQDPKALVAKARLVVRGNLVFDARGQRFFAAKQYMQNAGLAQVRVFQVAAVLRRLCLAQIDVKVAYPHAKRKGRKMFLEMGREETTIIDPKSTDLSRPVIPVDGSLYGDIDAGFEWDNKSRDDLIAVGFKPTVACANIFTRTKDGEFDMLLKYVDDLLPASKDPRKSYDEFATLWTLKDLEELGNYLGVHTNVAKVEDHLWVIQWSQSEYAKNMVKEFEDEFGELSAPHAMTACAMDATNWPQDDEVGKCAARASHYGGVARYLERGSRPDTSFVNNIISRNTSDWRKHADKCLRRFMSFVKRTADRVLNARIDPRDHENRTLIIEVCMDSDHAQCKKTRRSVASFNIWLSGPRTSALCEWKSVKESSIALSSGEAEIVAEQEATRSALKIQELLSELLGWEVPILGRTDATVAIGATNAGFSGQVGTLLRKCHDVSLKWLQERYTDPNSLEKIPSAVNPADLGTKPLDEEPSERHANALGLTDPTLDEQVKPATSTKGVGGSAGQ